MAEEQSLLCLENPDRVDLLGHWEESYMLAANSYDSLQQDTMLTLICVADSPRLKSWFIWFVHVLIISFHLTFCSAHVSVIIVPLLCRTADFVGPLLNSTQNESTSFLQVESLMVEILPKETDHHLKLLPWLNAFLTREEGGKLSRRGWMMEWWRDGWFKGEDEWRSLFSL